MFNSRLSKISNILFSTLTKSFSSQQPGNLYTWGTWSAGLGRQVENTDQNINKPRRIEHFDNNVVKVSMGYYHTAVITTDGELWTFGISEQGALGHGEKKEQLTPRPVDYFQNHNLKVVDVKCGKYHTFALTDNGQLYSWGYGGKQNIISSYLYPSFSGIAQAGDDDVTTPQRIETFSELPRIVDISLGFEFGLALLETGDIYGWGRGQEGQFGDGETYNSKFPIQNEQIQNIRSKYHQTFKKIKSANNYTLALTNNGQLYGWGHNDEGQVGYKANIGHIWDNDLKLPTKVDNLEFYNQKIVDFEVGENTSILLTENNKVYWAGLKLAYRPLPFFLPSNVKIQKITAGTDSYAALADNNRIYSRPNFIDTDFLDPETGAPFTDGRLFNDGQILDIGGSYRNHFAIVKN